MTAISREYAKLYGLSPDQRLLTYKEWLELVHPEDRGRMHELLRDTIERMQVYDTEFRAVWPDGSIHWVVEKAILCLGDAGWPAGITGISLDITNQKRADAELRRGLDEIAHLNRVAAMGELTASLAHEVSQPLAAILSNAQAACRFLGCNSPDLEQARECLADIVADDKRAGEVIKRLRALLKKGECQACLIDLNEVVGDVIRMLRNDALLRQTAVTFEPFAGLPGVLGDRVQIYQVVLNLMVNGLEAVAEQPLGGRQVLVRTANLDGGVQMTVEDSGGGIAESDLERVFEPFFSTKREGLGMGLSISRSIVDVHGGRIWAENTVGGGAIFRCLLPEAKRTVAAMA